MKPEEIASQKLELNGLVSAYQLRMTWIENAMADLLHIVLFDRREHRTRVAHAIYFTPDGFGQRQNIVNAAITEWIAENPLSEYDLQPMWNRINLRLNTVRGTRNLLAHGSVIATQIRGVMYVRVMPPTFSPKLADLISKGTIPGKSIAEMRNALDGAEAVLLCIQTFIDLLRYHSEEDEQAFEETFGALEENLSRLDRWFPDAQKIQVP